MERRPEDMEITKPADEDADASLARTVEMQQPLRAQGSPLAHVDKYKRKLGLALDQIFLLDDDKVDLSTISEVICLRLTERTENGGAVGYLASCFKRLQQKSSTSSDQRLKDDLDLCKKQIISFIVSSLSTPDMFGDNSVRSIADLLQVITSERSSTSNQLLKEVADELVEQTSFDEVRNTSSCVLRHTFNRS